MVDMSKPMAVNPAISHPDRSVLRRWVSGELSITDDQQIESHLQTCDRCAAELDTLVQNDDPLLVRLRELAASGTRMDDWHQSDTRAGQTEPADANDLLPSGSSADPPVRPRWRLIRKIGAGGIGEVWAAEDELLGREVAVKRLLPSVASNRSIQTRFLYEAKMTASLGHPGTVHMLDLHDDGPNSYYVMSLIRGTTLRETIESLHQSHEFDSPATSESEFVGRVILPLLRKWIRAVRTVAFAHQRNILHRDLKTDNVVLGDFDQVTVIDWGLAKRIGDAEPGLGDANDGAPPARSSSRHPSPMHTRVGVRLGTPSSMAPEQALGQIDRLDFRTDTYALSAMLYEILTGRPPFVGDNAEIVMRQAIDQHPVPPHQVRRRVPVALSRICQRGLAKSPADRFQTASELANHVERWIDDEVGRQQIDEARHQLFDLSDDLMMIIDRHRRVTWVNDAWPRLLGRPCDSLVGRDVNECFENHGAGDNDIGGPADDSSGGLVLPMDDLDQSGSTTCQRLMRTCGGQPLWFSWTTTALPDEGIVCAIGRNIDDQVRAQKEFAELLSAAPDAMVITDSDRVIQMVNRQVVELFGYESSELIGQRIEILLPHRFRRDHPDKVAEYQRRPEVRSMSQRRHLYARRRDGSEFEVAIRLSPVGSGSTIRYVASVRAV